VSRFDPVSALLKAGTDDRVYPSAQTVVIHRGRQVFSAHAGEASATTRFDLASLTKAMATTAIFMRLWAEGRIDPDARVQRWLPDSAIAKAGASVADLLYHRSGLPAFVPFFADLLHRVPDLMRSDCLEATRTEARDEVVRRASETAPERPIGSAAIYSDVGFILLGEILSRASAASLDVLFRDQVARRLALAARYQPISRHSVDDERDVAPTGRTRPREPAPGQEEMWARFLPAPTRPGEVDDDNAFVMDGVAGHAGLFGGAPDVALFGQAILEELAGANRIAPAGLWEKALAKDPLTPDSTRAFGFDTPCVHPGARSTVASSAGKHIGDTPPGAFGHLGFTGTSLWVDRARELVVALCTNRTYNGRANVRIRQFRPRFHDAVVEAIGG
jgi:CubicO group peptidase (beta-lactamase class C family)